MPKSGFIVGLSGQFLGFERAYFDPFTRDANVGEPCVPILSQRYAFENGASLRLTLSAVLDVTRLSYCSEVCPSIIALEMVDVVRGKTVRSTVYPSM